MNPSAVSATEPSSSPYPVINTAPIAGTNLWSTGLFNCLDDADGCIEGTFCGPCQRSRQYNMLHSDSTLNAMHYPSLLGPLFVDICLGIPLGQIAMTFHLRQELRRRYRLEGNDCQDAAAAVFCTDFATCQAYREMAARGEWSSGFCARPPVNVHAPVPVTMGEAVEGEVVEMAEKSAAGLPPQP